MRIGKFILTNVNNVLPGKKLSAARSIILKKCDLVVDIGSNDGQWMTDVRKNGYSGRALCIEPLLKNYNKLKSSKLGDTIFLNCAVGNSNGHLIMNEASNNGLSSSVLELDDFHKNGAPEIKYIRKERVESKKLSKILSVHKDKYKYIFIKIDTQGYEFEVLRSLSKKNFDTIYAFEVEVNLVSTYKGTHLIEDIIRFLRIKGFRPLRIESGFGMPNFGQQLQVDILFVKNANSNSI